MVVPIKISKIRYCIVIVKKKTTVSFISSSAIRTNMHTTACCCCDGMPDRVWLGAANLHHD